MQIRLSFLGLVSLCVGACFFSSVGFPQDADKSGDNHFEKSEVNAYIEKNLKTDPILFNISAQAKKFVPMPEKVFDSEIPGKVNRDADIIRRIFEQFLRTDHGNATLIANPGTGKSTLIPKIALVLSYSAMPEHIRKELQLENPLLKKFYDMVLNHTQVIAVNSTLLGKDNTAPGEAFQSQEKRIQAILDALVIAAEADFKNNRLRTLFVLDEAASFPEMVHESLKDPMSRAGFKDPGDEFQSMLDTGIMYLLATTPREAQKMISADGAKERRLGTIRWENMSADQAFGKLVDFSEVLKNKYAGLEVDEEALGYLVKMNDYIFDPPQFMPDSSKTALELLFTWFIFNRSENGKNKKITLQDAQHWFLKQTGLSDHWLPGPNGEPPFSGMPEYVKQGFKGSDEIVDQICSQFEVWARLGFPSRLTPIIILGGDTGAGKNTLAARIYKFIYGSEGAHQRFSVGAASGESFRTLFHGTGESGTSPGELPLIIQRRQNGNPPVGLTLDEAGDAPIKFFNDLKVLVENKIIQPIGRDNRERLMIHPIIFTGQYGKELFEGLNDTEVAEKMRSLSQEQIDNAFLHPIFAEPGHGAIPEAFLRRVKLSGGVYILPPTAKAVYPEIVQIHIDKIISEQSAFNDLRIDFTQRFKDQVVSKTLNGDKNPRSLEENLKRLALISVSKASEKGIPLRHAHLQLDSDEQSILVSVVGGGAKPIAVKFETLFGPLDSCDLAMINAH